MAAASVDQDQKWLIDCLTATLDTSREVRSFAETSLHQASLQPVRGALRCLALLSDDLDDTLVPKLVPTLFPYLHTIISSPQLYEKSLRAKALSIVHSCVSILGSMSGVYKTETIALMMPMVNSLMEHFSTILQPPMQSGDPDDWSIRMEVLKCLLQFIQNFPSLAEAQFSVIMTPLWQTFVSSLEVYQLSSIQGCEDSYSGRFDSDGGEKSLSTFVIQLLRHGTLRQLSSQTKADTGLRIQLFL